MQGSRVKNELFFGANKDAKVKTKASVDSSLHLLTEEGYKIHIKWNH